MGVDHRVGQCPDAVDRERGGRVGVGHQRVPNGLGAALDGGTDGEVHHREERRVEGGALRGERPRGQRRGAGAVEPGGHLDRRSLGQVVDQAGVRDVGLDLPRRAGDQAVHDLRCVLRGLLLGLDVVAALRLGHQPTGLLDVGRADADVVAQRDAQPLHLGVVLEVPRHVLRGVLARLRRVVAEPAVHVHAHPPPQLGVGRDQGVEPGVEVLLAVPPVEHPGLVVHTGAAVADLVERHADERAQVDDGPVDRVAQPEHLDPRMGRGQVADVHRHRVGVVEQPRVRADRLHVSGECVEEAEGAQAAEDAADAERVGDRLAHPEGLGHVEVRERRRVTADVHGVDHEVGTVEGGAPVRGRADDGLAPVVPHGDAGDLLGEPEPCGVVVVHDQGQRAEVVVGEQVAEQLPGELGGAGADEAQGGHRQSIAAHPEMSKIAQTQ